MYAKICAAREMIQAAEKVVDYIVHGDGDERRSDGREDLMENIYSSAT